MVAVWVVALLREHPAAEVDHEEDMVALVEPPNVLAVVAARACWVGTKSVGCVRNIW